MNKRFLLRLILRNLMVRKMRTFLTITGVAISIAFITFLVAVGLGLQRVSTSQITNIEALEILDVTAGKSTLVSIRDEEIEKFNKLGNVEMVLPHFQVAARIKLESSSIDGIVYGKDPKSLPLEDIKMVKGNEGLEENSLLITTAALKQLGIMSTDEVTGKDVNLTLVPKKEVLILEEQEKENLNKEITFKISGIINNENAAFVYIHIEQMKSLGFEQYDGAKIKVHSQENVEQAKQKLEGMGFKTTSLKNTIDQVNQFFYVFQIILVGFGAIAVLVSCLGMFNTLTINLLEKTREVGFMKVLGTTSKDVYTLFMGESLFIGVFGGLAGIFIAWFFGTGMNFIIYSLAQASGNKAVELFYMPFWFVVFVIIAITIISLATGWWPSHRASKINPLDAIRYE